MSMSRLGLMIVAGIAVFGLFLGGPAEAKKKKKKDPTAAWQGLYSVGVMALQKKDFKAAEKALEEAFEIAQEMDSTDPRQRRTLDALIRLYQRQRQWAAAEPWLEKMVSVDEEKLGKDHPDLSFVLARLAKNNLMMRKYEAAEAAYLRAIEIREKSKGFDEARVVVLRNNLAETYRRWRKTDKAEALYKSVLQKKEAKLGPTHPLLATSLNDLALIYNQARKYKLALPLLQRAHKLSAKLAKTNLRAVGRIKDNLATSFTGLGNYEKAEKLYVEAIGIAKVVKPVDRPGLGNTYYNLANLYQYTKRLDKAVAQYKLSVAARRMEYGGRHPRVKKANLALASALDQQGKSGEAATIRAKYGK